jgi:protein SCO1
MLRQILMARKVGVAVRGMPISLSIRSRLGKVSYSFSGPRKERPE